MKKAWFGILFLLIFFAMVQKALPSEIYIDDPDNDSYNPVGEGYIEIRRIEVDKDSIIIVANSTPSSATSIGIKYYIIFIDVNADGLTDFSLLYQSGIEYKLYRFNDSCYYTGEYWSTEVTDFNGEVAEENAVGKTIFRIGNVISGKIRLKVAALLYNPSIKLFCSDFAPNCPLDITENMVTYKQPFDEIFKYPNVEIVISGESNQSVYNPLIDWIIKNLILVTIITLVIIATVILIIRKKKH